MRGVLLAAFLVAAPLSVLADRPGDACRSACRAEYYDAYLACVRVARKTSQLAHCYVLYQVEVRECIAAQCR